MSFVDERLLFCESLSCPSFAKRNEPSPYPHRRATCMRSSCCAVQMFRRRCVLLDHTIRRSSVVVQCHTGLLKQSSGSRIREARDSGTRDYCGVVRDVVVRTRKGAVYRVLHENQCLLRVGRFGRLTDTLLRASMCVISASKQVTRCSSDVLDLLLCRGNAPYSMTAVELRQ